MSKLSQAAANIRATSVGAMRTGSTRHGIAPGPVTIIYGPGSTNMPATLDGLAPVKHPEPKPVQPYTPGQVSRFAPVPRNCPEHLEDGMAANVEAQQEQRTAKARKPAKAIRIAPCTIDDSRYVRSHNKAPRGRGAWVFKSKGMLKFQHTGLYSEAKVAARNWAREHGYGTTATGCLLLHVCP